MRKNFFNNKNKLCGWWVDGVYRKRVNSQKHRLKVADAYGIDKCIIEELKTLKTVKIRVLEEDKGVVLDVDFDFFIEKGFERNLDTPQVFLPVRYFNQEFLQNTTS